MILAKMNFPAHKGEFEPILVMWPCAVILDHGLYRDLDEKFRTNFCRLWRALILLDGEEILETGKNLGAGQYARFLPVIFTGRAITRYDSLLFYIG